MATESLVIIGSGPAGLTAGMYAARANLNPLLIEGTTPGGQLLSTSIVENWPGITSISGPALMQQLRTHAQEFGTRLLAQQATSCQLNQHPFTITTAQQTITARAIIVASGAQPKRLGCPGESEYWGKGVSSCAVCDGALFASQPMVVIGGGDTAMEDAAFLTKFSNNITVIQLGDKLTASNILQQRVLNNPAITILYHSAVTSIQGDGSKVESITFTDTRTHKSTTLPTAAVFVAIGLKPATQFLGNQLALTPQGFVQLYPDRGGQSCTSIPGVFAAGDVADMVYRQAITAAGTGCAAALDAEQWLEQLKKSAG
jgi:thioredoxin reductase (NADPH)